MRGAAASDLPTPDAIATLDHPRLVLAWAGDPGHPESTAERLHELLPDSELRVATTVKDLFTWTRHHRRLPRRGPLTGRDVPVTVVRDGAPDRRGLRRGHPGRFVVRTRREISHEDLDVAARVAAVVALTLTGIALVTISTPAAAAKQPLARATLVNAAGDTVGEVVFKGPGKYADRVEVEIVASAAPNLGSFHGFHIHTTGVCNPAPSGSANAPFGSAGGHWNPAGANHGAHKGDLPSALLTAEGETYAEFETDRFNVAELLDAGGDGSAVILHVGADNFANIATYGGPNTATLATGDAGRR